MKKQLINLDTSTLGKIDSCSPQSMYDVHKAIKVLSNPCINMFVCEDKAYPEDDLTTALSYAIYALKLLEDTNVS